MLNSTQPCLRMATQVLRMEPMRAVRSSYSKPLCRAASSLSHHKSPLALRSKPFYPSACSRSSTLPSPIAIRSASFASASGAAAPSSSADAGPSERLDWNTFFKLRKSRRRYNLIASVVTSAGTVVGGLFVLAQQDLDPMSVSIFGLDPMLLFGLTIAGFGTIGWLVGPFLGNAMFRMLNKRFNHQMTVKEKEFYRRIKEYRVDPSSQSLSNPVPDYYGEKVSSVAGYRQWMKDQRAYNKKRQNFL
ncbi:MAG: hypothetical protein M4579_004433 [Chaenotheca gracillima]|nr:MAG: hypothetical protein M4579_004433 [Chaenotheca gracillima]